MSVITKVNQNFLKEQRKTSEIQIFQKINLLQELL